MATLGYYELIFVKQSQYYSDLGWYQLVKTICIQFGKVHQYYRSDGQHIVYSLINPMFDIKKTNLLLQLQGKGQKHLYSKIVLYHHNECMKI